MAIVSRRLLSFLSCLFVIIISQASAQVVFLDHHCDSVNGNFEASSAYQTNLNTLLSTLSSNPTIDYGFYNFSYGQNNDKVNAIGLCRGDIKPQECRKCLSDSSVVLTKLCPTQKEAIGWSDNCMLRYAQRSIFGLMENAYNFYVWSLHNVTDVNQLDQGLSNLLDGLRSRAISGDSRLKFAAAHAILPNFQYIYGLVQCTPDLSWGDCDDCLVGAISQIPNCCKDKIGGRVAGPSCNIRFNLICYNIKENK